MMATRITDNGRLKVRQTSSRFSRECKNHKLVVRSSTSSLSSRFCASQNWCRRWFMKCLLFSAVNYVNSLSLLVFERQSSVTMVSENQILWIHAVRFEQRFPLSLEVNAHKRNCAKTILTVKMWDKLNDCMECERNFHGSKERSWKINLICANIAHSSPSSCELSENRTEFQTQNEN